MEIKGVLEKMDVDDFVNLIGKAEADLVGLDPFSLEGQYEGTQAAVLYAVIVHQTVSKLLDSYRFYHDSTASETKTSIQENKTKSHPLLQTSLQRTSCNNNGQTVIQTAPLFASEKFGLYPIARWKSG